MSGAWKMVKAILVALTLVALLSQTAFTNLPGANIPPGFDLIISDTGTALYWKNYPEGNPDFVQVVRLNQGATVKLLHGEIVDPGHGQGVYGGSNPLFFTQALYDVWDDFSQRHPNVFCITNGQFFSVPAAAARLPFPLKTDGKIVSDGYGINQFPDQKLMLEIWPDRADIAPLSEAALYSSSAPNIVAGLSEEASGRRPNWPTGRTFVGVADLRPDGKYETILIFNSRIARKTEAAGALRGFGAQKVMMLDGGASTQLICQGESYIGAGRKIPQTIAVMAARPGAETHIHYQSGLFLSCEMEALLAWPHYRQDAVRTLWC